MKFLQEDEGGVIPIEVKSGFVTKAKSLQSFIQKYHPPYHVILSGKNFSFDAERSRYQTPLYLAAKVANLLKINKPSS